MDYEKLWKHLENIENSLQILIKINIAKLIDQEILNEADKKIYQITGLKGQTDICKEMHVSSKKLSNLWNSWYKLGILRREGKVFKKVLD